MAQVRVLRRAATLTFGILSAAWATSPQAAETKIVELTQLACQFLESENGTDRQFTSARKADCEAINARTAQARLSSSEPLRLKAGQHVFRVVNKSVPYELGFWLRGSGTGRLTLPSVSGGGLLRGHSRDYAIDLKPGEYVYSCPLNTTPDYRLVVE